MLGESAAPFTAALLAGVTYGTAYCGPSCGPFLCTYVMGSAPGSMQALKSMSVFTIARVATYGIIGSLSALLGTVVSQGSNHGSMVLGFVVTATGIMMWRRSSDPKESDQPVQIGKPMAACGARCFRAPSTMPLWLAGAAFALAPCPPMLAMLACSAHAGSPIAGATIMMLFGLGTAISPLFLAGVLAGHFSERIRRLAPGHALLFRRTASLTLVVLGCVMVVTGG